MARIEVEVPDCINVQPWWESSGMTVAAFLLCAMVIVAVTVCMIDWRDTDGSA